MSDRRVATFFYGSFMDDNILKQLGVVAERSEVAVLPGYEIEMRPRVNLLPSNQYVVCGSVMHITHSDLDRLYSLGQRDLQALGVIVPVGAPTDIYHPEPVVVSVRDGLLRPALCYIADAQEPALPPVEYVDSVVGAARKVGLPEWYIKRLASFRP